MTLHLGLVALKMPCLVSIVSAIVHAAGRALVLLCSDY
jgi:hypothetical protein